MSRRSNQILSLVLSLAFGALGLTACGGSSSTPPPTDDRQLPVTADANRGGLLYDKWWTIIGAPAPTTTHPDYPPAGSRSGDTTWRCKECHGWDYLGVDGAYGSGSHFTGIIGVLGAQGDAPGPLFDAIKGGTTHDFSGVLSDDDIWDLVAFIQQGTIDMRTWIDLGTGTAMGSAAAGDPLYVSTCAPCHGADGHTFNFGCGEGVGDVAGGNPWEALHKIRWGHPGSSPTMPGQVAAGSSTQDQVDILTYAQTLPPAGVSFECEVYPILQANCTPCHQAPGASGNLTLIDPDASVVRGNILTGGDEGSAADLGTPANSLIYRKPQGLDGHGGGDLGLGASELQSILDWIAQGALDN